MSSALLVGLAILLLWPLLNVGLVSYAAVLAAADERPSRQRSRRHHLRRHGSRRPSGWREPVGSASPVRYWLVIPCLNEERVVAGTVRAALALAAGEARVRVLVVDDGSDDATPRVLADLRTRWPPDRLEVLRRELPDARAGKGAALNAAYRLISRRTNAAGLDPARVVIGVLDADGRASDNLLTEVAAGMRDPRVGAVQVRVRIRDRARMLQMAQDLEFGSVADASQLVRDRLGSVGLGGNGQFLRLSALAGLGPAPWSGCLVEDLELGLRLHLAGVRIRYRWRAEIAQQGLPDVRRLLRQRTRWAQGNLQCLPYLGRFFADRRIPNHAFLEMSYYLLAPWLNAVGAVVVGGFWTATAVRISLTSSAASAGVVLAVVVTVWIALMLAPGLLWATVHRIRVNEDSWGRCLRGGLAYPLLLLLGLVSTWRAVGRQLVGRRGWAKTERLLEPPAPRMPEQVPA